TGPLSIGIALLEPLAELTRRVVRCVMLAREPLDAGLEVVRKRCVGVVEIVEERFAAGRGCLNAIEEARLRGQLVVAHVLMPNELRISEASSRLPIHDNIGDDSDFGEGHRHTLAGWWDRRHVELAKLV